MNRTSVINSIEKIPDYWKQAILSVFAASLLCFFIFFDTWVSLVEIWSRSKTYTHGFIIAPISIWLIWSNRHQFQNLVPVTHRPALTAIVLFGFLWLAATIIQVQVVQQYAAVALLIACFWSILGSRVALAMVFPLAFLLLMVPVGETLIPPLMEYTATFTVAMLRLTGLSVYREGMHFSLTSGNWSVVEACSGINYLIASITLGLVFAYVTYTSYWKRGIFFIFSILVPILANGFRAYMIVMIGHLSGMKLAVGVDHILYGAVFFGIVIMILFYVGSFWKDPANSVSIITSDNETANDLLEYSPFKSTIPVICLSLIIWPIASSWLSDQQNNSGLRTDFSVLEKQLWKPAPEPFWGWNPGFDGVAQEALNYFQNDEQTVGLYQANFGAESQGGSELVNSEHFLISTDDRKSHIWHIYKSGQTVLSVKNNDLTVDKSILRGKYKDLIVLRWYLIGSTHTANPYYAKLLQLLKRLTGDTKPELQIILFADAKRDHYQSTEIRLKEFANSWLTSLF